VLKQLAAYVGIEHFLAGLRDYFTSTPTATRRWAICWWP